MRRSDPAGFDNPAGIWYPPLIGSVTWAWPWARFSLEKAGGEALCDSVSFAAGKLFPRFEPIARKSVVDDSGWSAPAPENVCLMTIGLLLLK